MYHDRKGGEVRNISTPPPPPESTSTFPNQTFVPLSNEREQIAFFKY